MVQDFNVFIIFIIGFEGRNLHLKELQGIRVFSQLLFKRRLMGLEFLINLSKLLMFRYSSMALLCSNTIKT